MAKNINKKPFRVLHLGSPMGLYGAERWILALVKHLDRAVVESHVGVIKDSPDVDAPLCLEAEKMGLKVHIIEAYGKANLHGVKALRKVLVEEEIDILHTHFYKTDVIGLAAVRGTNCKIVTTPHGWSKKVDFKLLGYELLDRAIFPFMDAVVPLSEDLYRPLRYMPGMGRKLHFIRNGVDISEIDASVDVAPELADWKKKGAFIVGYIGQLISRKGLDVLFNALASLKSVNWRLALIGEGPQRTELEELARSLGIEQRVVFFGFRPDRLTFLRGFDLFALPSQLEGIPRCLMEAMAAEVAVVASNIPGCSDLVTHGQTGLLHEQADEKMLGQAIEQIAGQPTFAADLVKRARKLVEDKYSGARMAKEYMDLYQKIQ